ncbi:MAG: hypothetical protein P8M72_00850 [Gammaproteobacteria bacterium]|nr:hypothetical protein [Gammaproteobacteria bacterium]
MARNHDLDVLHIEPQRLHVRYDDVMHRIGARVVENMAIRCGDEIGAVRAAHPVNVIDDAEGFR